MVFSNRGRYTLAELNKKFPVADPKAKEEDVQRLSDFMDRFYDWDDLWDEAFNERDADKFILHRHVTQTIIKGLNIPGGLSKDKLRLEEHYETIRVHCEVLKQFDELGEPVDPELIDLHDDVGESNFWLIYNRSFDFIIKIRISGANEDLAQWEEVWENERKAELHKQAFRDLYLKN